MRPVVLSIAGSDCSGGAGIQADIKAIEASGGFAATALTALTVQDGMGVRRIAPAAPDLVVEQIDAVFDDLPVAAVKSGMLAAGAIIDAVACALERHRPRHYVLDPVLAAGRGGRLLPAADVERLCARLFPLASLVTPNVPEAEELCGMPLRDPADAERAARTLLERGARAVLIKGGHLPAQPGSDVLVSAAGVRVFRAAFIDAPHSRGTGCALASAIAARLACGQALEDAVEGAKAFVGAALAAGARCSVVPGR